MASNEMQKSSSDKEPKTPPPPSSQAYSSMPPRGFVASSPQPHPYMWGVQHMMPPYGTPAHQYVTMYPPGGVYGHPSMHPGSYQYSPYAMPSQNGMAEASGDTSEGDATKQSEVKEKLPIKRSRGSLGSLNMITGKNSGASANGAYSKRTLDLDNTTGRMVGFMIIYLFLLHLYHVTSTLKAACLGRGGSSLIGSLLEDPGYANRYRFSKLKSPPCEQIMDMVLCVFQAECDELAQRAEVLNEENASLRAEINKLRSQCEELTS
ncbi:hypothetical protein F2Q69_00017371 [Brassica cretica]|uniref:BZIP domain-containing protein n=1 Tax=Brassica cretica TaxID=69181 RepID=A0A8S9QQZ8_BRACR|nr:hypothetical protein F2Q69_00017371 [Brassica cretica]